MSLFRKKATVDEILESAEFHAEYLQMLLTNDILEAKDSQGLSTTEIAKNIKVSKQYISKVLNDSPSSTILAISRIAAAVERKLFARVVTVSEYNELAQTLFEKRKLPASYEEIAKGYPGKSKMFDFPTSFSINSPNKTGEFANGNNGKEASLAA